MRDLKTYIGEAVKPPRLSAKNRYLWKDNLEEEVVKWLKTHDNSNAEIEIVDGKINVKGDVNLCNNTKEIPYPFGIVTGDFDVSGTWIKSLKNCPEEVGSRFSCTYCRYIKSLEYAPKKVKGDFMCYGCSEKFTVDGVRKVCDVGGKIFV